MLYKEMNQEATVTHCHTPHWFPPKVACDKVGSLMESCLCHHCGGPPPWLATSPHVMDGCCARPLRWLSVLVLHSLVQCVDLSLLQLMLCLWRTSCFSCIPRVFFHNRRNSRRKPPSSMCERKIRNMHPKFSAENGFAGSFIFPSSKPVPIPRHSRFTILIEKVRVANGWERQCQILRRLKCLGWKAIP